MAVLFFLPTLLVKFRFSVHSQIDCIGILNHLFWPEQYRRTGGMSIVFLFDENPDVASAGSGGAAVGGARSVPDHAARSNSERAAPSAGVGRRYSAVRWSGINRLDGPGSAAGAGRQAQVGEDFDDHQRIFDGGPSTRLRTGDDLQPAAAVRAVFDVDVEDPFEQPGPTQARRRVIACGRGCLLWRTGDNFTTQLCVRREHAMEATCPEPVERD
jgi:hypothetical protein